MDPNHKSSRSSQLQDSPPPNASKALNRRKKDLLEQKRTCKWTKIRGEKELKYSFFVFQWLVSLTWSLFTASLLFMAKKRHSRSSSCSFSKHPHPEIKRKLNFGKKKKRSPEVTWRSGLQPRWDGRHRKPPKMTKSSAFFNGCKAPGQTDAYMCAFICTQSFTSVTRGAWKRRSGPSRDLEAGL